MISNDKNNKNQEDSISQKIDLIEDTCLGIDCEKEIFSYSSNVFSDSSDVLKQSNPSQPFYVSSFYLPTNDIEITEYLSFELIRVTIRRYGTNML